MANSEMLELISEDQYKKVQEITALIKQLVENINKANAASKNLKNPSGFSGGTKGNNDNTNSGNKLLIEQERLINKIADARKKEALENTKLKLQLAELNKEQKKAAQEALSILTSYQKLSAEFNEASSNAKSLGAELFRLEQAGEQNTQQYIELANAYELANREANLLRQGLDRIDQNVGDYRRNVGNYESGWNGLGNSINQLTREFPAFSNSVQTGLLGISNNIAPIADEINRIIAQNRELQAQGRPTVSVLSQIGRALFSWQTLLSTGITLLTVYGKELVDWTRSLFNAKSQIDQLAEAQERYLQTTSDAITNSQQQYNTINYLNAVIRDNTKSLDERANAAKRLFDMFPGYYKSEQDILNNTVAYSKATTQLTEDLRKRADAEAKQAKASETLKVAADLEQEIELRERANRLLFENADKYGYESGFFKQYQAGVKAVVDARAELYKEDAKFKETIGSVGQATSGNVILLGAYDQSAIHELKQRAVKYREVYKQQQEETTDVFRETSLLDYKKIQEERKKIDEEQLADFEAAQYELRKTVLEGESEYYREVMENEQNGYADREYAAKEFNKRLIALADLRLAEDIRLAEHNTEQLIKEQKKRITEDIRNTSNANAIIKSLQKQRDFDIQTAHEVFSQAIIAANKEVEDSFSRVFGNISVQERQNRITQQTLNNYRELSNILGNVSAETSLKQFTDIQNRLAKINESNVDNQIETLRNQRNDIQLEIEKIQAKEVNKENNEAINKLLAEQYQIDEQLLNIEIKRKQAISDLTRQMKEATASYLNSFSEGVFADFGVSELGKMFDQVEYQVINSLGEIETRTGSTFDKLIDQAGTLQEKFAVAFNTSLQVAQQFYNALQQYSNARFEREYAEAERSYKIATQFYGQTEEARAELERQYEEKRREIRRAELRAAKEQAIFNATINTAQGVTAALGQANYALAIIIGALGAAQIALIASQEIPAYKDGVRNAPGGLSLVGDGGRSEIIQTPSGNLYRTPDVDTLVNLPKGSNVYKSDADFLRNSGVLNTTPKVDWNGGRMPTAKEMAREIGNEIKNIPTSNTILHEGGFKTWVNKGHGRMETFNNKVQMKGVSVK